MDEGKPAVPRAKWWSRPAPGRARTTADPVPTAGEDLPAAAGRVDRGELPERGTPTDRGTPADRAPYEAAAESEAPYDASAPVQDEGGDYLVKQPDAVPTPGDAAAADSPVRDRAVEDRHPTSLVKNENGTAEDRHPTGTAPTGTAHTADTPAPGAEADTAHGADTAVTPAPGVAAHTAHTAHAADTPAPGVAAGEGVGGGQPVEAVVPRRSGPLHDPDPYGTPPYGGPGPWAPAPPVQRPTPAQGTHVPPQPPAPAAGTHASPQFSAPQPPLPHLPEGSPLPPHHQPPQPPPAPGAPQQSHSSSQYPPSQWLSYDPWSAAPPQQPLTYAGPPPRKRRRGSLLVGALLIALVAGGVGGGVGAYIERNNGLTGPVQLPQSDKAPRDRAPDTVAGIAASALPSVVTFHVSGSSGKGTGTGFVLDNKGHILTNNHVVEPAGASGVISITFSSGESAKAKLVGKDSGYDLAVVKVVGVSGLKPLPLGNSDNVRVGDPVVAIGAPYDLQNTVTSGIISAKQRPITAGGEKGDGSDISYVDALQTDAPINPGNSGGPLVDGQARVIGINSAIRGPDSGSGLEGGQGGSIGLGFAIPINQAKRVAEEIINTGRATHPVIGVSLDMKYTGDGAQVGTKGADNTPSVTPGGPGAKAGIKPGDVITRIDGERVHSGEELIVKIRSRKPGDLLRLTLRRDAQEREVSLKLGSAGDS